MVGLISKDNTAWQEAPFSSYFETDTATGQVSDLTGLLVRKENHIVNITGIINPTASISGSANYYDIIETPLDSEYRPISSIKILSSGAGSYVWLLTISTDGKVLFSRYRNTSSYASCGTSSTLYVNATYITVD